MSSFSLISPNAKKKQKKQQPLRYDFGSVECEGGVNLIATTAPWFFYQQALTVISHNARCAQNICSLLQHVS